MVFAQASADEVDRNHINAAVVIRESTPAQPVAQRGEVYWWLYTVSEGQFALAPRPVPTSSVPFVLDQVGAHTNTATSVWAADQSIVLERTSARRHSTPRISYENREKVRAFLDRHPEIRTFIRAALPALHKCFGSAVSVVLEVLVYPEQSGPEELVAWIQSTDEVYEGLEKLERFEDEWFLDHLAETGGIFNFNVETV